MALPNGWCRVGGTSCQHRTTIRNPLSSPYWIVRGVRARRDACAQRGRYSSDTRRCTTSWRLSISETDSQSNGLGCKCFMPLSLMSMSTTDNVEPSTKERSAPPPFWGLAPPQHRHSLPLSPVRMPSVRAWTSLSSGCHTMHMHGRGGTNTMCLKWPPTAPHRPGSTYLSCNQAEAVTK